MDEQAPVPAETTRTPRRRMGLAARVLALVVAFVMAAEAAIFIPSVANYRYGWLTTRLAGAYTAALVLDASPDGMTPDPLKIAILDSVGAKMIVLKTRDRRRMLAIADIPPEIDEMEDLRSYSLPGAVAAAFRTLTAEEGRVIDVRAAAPAGAEFVEIAMDETPLQEAMQRYAVNILALSLAISLFVAALVIAALHMMVLAPVRRLTGNLVAFAAAPEEQANVITPSAHTPEIARAEEALAAMQRTLSRALRERKRLAELGLAVAKINHDLRNMLTSAQLLSDRMAEAGDPLVARNAPKLVATLDRAIRFCQSTLAYGRTLDETPKLERVDLRPVAQEALEMAVQLARTSIESRLEIVGPLVADADAEQMFRVVNNLCRNAVEVLDQAQGDVRRAILVSGVEDEGNVVLRVFDSGPGLPEKARRNLFVAFQGGARAGGTGLGLAIAADLVRAHGGAIRVLDEDPDGHWPGARFEITIPATASA